MSIVGDLSQKVRRFIMDAPIDGKLRGRKDGEWVEVEQGGASSSPLNLFSKPARGKPVLTKVSATSVSLPAGLSVATLGVAVTLPASITLTLAGNLKAGTATPGTDYFVYLKPDATAYISVSDTETDARLIGGFHYGLTGHTEAPSGNKTEADMQDLR